VCTLAGVLSCIVKGVGWCVCSESCTVSGVVWSRCLDGGCVSTLCCAVRGMLREVWYDESSQWWRVVHM